MKKTKYNLDLQLFAENDPPALDAGATDYINEIDKLKKSTVSKSDYDKIVAERKALAEALANNRPSEDTDPPAPEGMDKAKLDREKELRASINKFDEARSNLDYFKEMLELRGLIMERGKPDPFGENRENVAEGLQSMVDEANDDPIAFMSIFERTVRDDPAILTALNAKRKGEKQ